MVYLPEYEWQPEKFSFRKKRQQPLKAIPVNEIRMSYLKGFLSRRDRRE